MYAVFSGPGSTITTSALHIDFKRSYIFKGIAQTFPKLESLKISGSFESIEKSDFEGLQDLKRLVLNGVPLDNIPRDAFLGLTSLEELTLIGSNVTDIPQGVFELSQSLKNLTISGNKLKNLRQEMFQYLINLETVTITEPNFKFENLNFSPKLPSLTVLKLHGCMITELPKDIFANMEQLVTLILSNNRLTSINQKLFRHLKQLKTLDLSYNPLDTFSGNEFEGLSSLEILNIENCGLKVLPENSTSDLPNLRQFLATSNHISRLETNTFESNSKIERVYFNNNNLEIIHVNFLNIPSIKYIQLRNNDCVNVIFSKEHADDDIQVQGNQILFSCHEDYKDVILKIRACIKTGGKPIQCVFQAAYLSEGDPAVTAKINNLGTLIFSNKISVAQLFNANEGIRTKPIIETD